MQRKISSVDRDGVEMLDLDVVLRMKTTAKIALYDSSGVGSNSWPEISCLFACLCERESCKRGKTYQLVQ